MMSLNVSKTQYRVSDFLSWQRAKTLILSPRFQRNSVWSAGAKSYLIDTIVQGLPIPIIFLREQLSELGSLEPKREVVDGQQRLRTLITYIEPTLLDDYNPRRDDFKVKAVHNADLAGLRFSDLSTELQQRILNYEFSVHVLSSGVDDREVLSIFARMNSTGTKLNPQELRNAQYHGAFKASMYGTAHRYLQQWRTWQIFSEDQIARMQEVELTSEFAYFMIKGLTSKSKVALDALYKDNDDNFTEGAEFERRFETIMQTIDDRIADLSGFEAFRLKALFYGVFVLLYEIQYGIQSSLAPANAKPVTRSAIAGLSAVADAVMTERTPEIVHKSITKSNTNLQERTNILEYLKEMTGNA